ncbi:MAG: hypothetical protein KDD22_01235 [Bdellovibrionales bacterium]|nr:hypothetical protein [Bdellovibrionales bacterium]
MILMALVKGSVIPAIVVGVLGLLLGFMPKVIGNPLRKFLLPLGFLIGYYNLTGIPQWPPSGSTGSLFFVALLCIPWAFLSARRPRIYQFLKWPLWAGTVFLILRTLIMNGTLPGNLAFFTGQLEILVKILMIILAGEVLWWTYDRGSMVLHRCSLALVPLLVMTAMSLALLFSASGLLSQLAGTYCAIQAAVMVLAYLRPKYYDEGSFEVFTVVLIFAFAVIGFFYLDITLMNMGLLLCPLLIMGLWHRLPMTPHTESAQLITLTAVSLIPLSLALWPMYQAYQSTGY